MNDFFIHQAIGKNTEIATKLSQQLVELKALISGELAKDAATELRAVSEQLTSDVGKVRDGVDGIVRELKTAHNALHDATVRLKKLLIAGCGLLLTFVISEAAHLWFLAHHAH